MEHLIIADTMNGSAPAALFMILFLSIILYLLLTMLVEKSRYDDLKEVKKMIEAGHTKALKGKKDDGSYRESKHLKEDQEEECIKIAKEEARRDLALLSRR